MAEFTVEIIGDNRDQLAYELKDCLTAQQGQVQIFTETERAIDAITVVTVVLTALQAADIVWKWWQNSRKKASKVTIRTASGRVIELSNVDQKQIERILEEDE
jgi:hypothetical protein